LEISNGADASVRYFNSHIKEMLENGELREHLLKYCCLDTEGMIWIVDALRKLVG
jgi:hypothetical protein